MMPDAEVYRALLEAGLPALLLTGLYFTFESWWRRRRWSRAVPLERDPLIRLGRLLTPPVVHALDPGELAIARSVRAQGPLLIAGMYVSPEVEGWNLVIGECRRRGKLKPLRLEFGLSDDEVAELLAEYGLRLMEQGPTANAIFASYLWFLQ